MSEEVRYIVDLKDAKEIIRDIGDEMDEFIRGGDVAVPSDMCKRIIDELTEKSIPSGGEITDEVLIRTGYQLIDESDAQYDAGRTENDRSAFYNDGMIRGVKKTIHALRRFLGVHDDLMDGYDDISE